MADRIPSGRPSPASPPAAGGRSRVGPADLTSALYQTLSRRLVPLVPGALGRGPERDGQRRPLLYLTIDDGPDPESTPRWLDALAAWDARAVFFLTAARAEAHPALARRIADAGHRVASHGYTHADPWSRRPADLTADVNRAQVALEAILGVPVRDVRPPYGRVTPTLLRWAEAGRRVVLWDVLPGDWLPARSPRALADAVLRDARAGSVVVLHDGAPAPRAIAAAGLALPSLRAAGWRFPALPAAPALSALDR